MGFEVEKRDTHILLFVCLFFFGGGGAAKGNKTHKFSGLYPRETKLRCLLAIVGGGRSEGGKPTNF